MLVLDGLFITT